MAILHLLEQGSSLRLRAGRVVVEVDGEALADFPARKLKMVVVYGNVRLTTPVLRFFLQSGVPVVYASLEGRLYGLASAREVAPLARLRAQFAATASPLRLTLAQAFVSSKLRSAKVLLKRLQHYSPEVATAIGGVEALCQRVSEAS